MDSEDDMIVVIIGDEDEPEENPVQNKVISVKHEPTEVPDDPEFINEFIETVEKHGEKIDMEFDVTNLKEENFYYEEEEFVDEDFLQTSEQGVFLRKRQKFYEDNSNQRHSMRKPEERQSLVDCVRQAHPEYQENSELLIQHLMSIMKAVKPPPPPDGYYYLNQKGLYACFKCHSESWSLPAASRHYQEKHGPRYLICYACGVDFRSTTNLYKHEKCCASPDAVYVLKARARCLGKKGRSRPYLPTKEDIITEMKRYKSKAYPKQSYQCSECPARFQCATTLQAHTFMHAGLRPFKCFHCSAAYTSKAALARHEAKHKDREYICDHCERSFKVKAALVAHMDTHKPEKKHGCVKCGKRYSQRAALLLHIRKEHLQLPPPFVCQICERRFARMYLLKTHMKDKHGMIIMTRKMFFKSLPTMSESQIVEKAKLIFKSNSTPAKKDLAEEFLESIENAQQFQEVDSIEEGELVNGGVIDSEQDYYYIDNDNKEVISENQEIEYYHVEETETIIPNEVYIEQEQESETKYQVIEDYAIEQPEVNEDSKENVKHAIDSTQEEEVITDEQNVQNQREMVVEITGTRLRRKIKVK